MKTKNFFAYFTLSVVVAVALPTMLTPYVNYRNFYQIVNNIPVSNISEDEFDALNWIRKNVSPENNPNAYFISDYATAYLIRGMTDLNTTASRHPHMNVHQWEMMQSYIKLIFVKKIDSSTQNIVNSIRKATQSTDVYLVLSKRTCWWTKQPSPLRVRFLPLPADYSWTNYCSDIDKKIQIASLFEPIFRNKAIAIFRYRI